MGEDWQNAAYVTPCLHKFCYVCILQWAEDKPQCPLCKGRIITIMHSVRADNNFEEHVITPSAASSGMYCHSKPEQPLLRME
uniref:RING-type E3 ubiquitin transferase n=1 Tax=Aquila chrysaetos chrysaetos TaxID=223781 RepID=A0A663FGW0_AQUCH